MVEGPAIGSRQALGYVTPGPATRASRIYRLVRPSSRSNPGKIALKKAR
jgi:hypothetical protein